MASQKTETTKFDTVDIGRSASGQHSAQCKICGHPEQKQIEEMILNGIPHAMIADHEEVGNPDHLFTRKTVAKHMNARDLGPHVRRSTAAIIDAMLDQATLEDIALTEKNIGTLLKTRAATTGELSETHKHEFVGDVDVQIASNRIRDNLREQIGLGLRPNMIALPMYLKDEIVAWAKEHPELDLDTILFVEGKNEKPNDSTAVIGGVRHSTLVTDDIEAETDTDQGDGHDSPNSEGRETGGGHEV